MKLLAEAIPEPEKVLALTPEKLGLHLLHVLKHPDLQKVKRAEVARTLAEPYHEDFKHQIAHAIEEALGWLASQCLLGASPYDQDLIFITRRGKALTQSEHPADVV